MPYSGCFVHPTAYVTNERRRRRRSFFLLLLLFAISIWYVLFMHTHISQWIYIKMDGGKFQ